MYNYNSDYLTELQREYLILADKCAKHTNFKYRNHCILRIACDNAVQDDWRKVVKKPFIKNATPEQLKDAVNRMIIILYGDMATVDIYNEQSLAYRGKI